MNALCLECGEPIPGDRFRKRAKTCSGKCSKLHERKRYRNVNPCPNISPGAVGALNELRASVDLMLRGWEVFRALSPSSPCDMVAFRNGTLLRVEVTTGYITPGTGKLAYSKHIKDKRDILAVVLHNGSISYFPDLPSEAHIA